MKIGIIGAGNIGSALARHFGDLGHIVGIANSRGPETLSRIAEETGARPVDVLEAAKDVDLLVIAISQYAVALLPKDVLRELPAGSPVIDTGNYIPLRDGRIEDIESGLPESEWVAGVLKHPVIKVFNNIIAPNLVRGGLSKGSEDRIALPVSGDDAVAKRFVIALLDDMGFDGIDAGPLSESWRQQPGNPAYTTDFDAEGLRVALAHADRSDAPRMRNITTRIALGLPPDTRLEELTVEKILRLPPGPSPQEQLRQIRALWL